MVHKEDGKIIPGSKDAQIEGTNWYQDIYSENISKAYRKIVMKLN